MTSSERINLVEQAPMQVFPGQINDAHELAVFGIACHAIIIASKADIFTQIREQGFVEESKISSKPIITAAVRALVRASILIKRKNRYFSTALGNDVLENLGLFTILFEGYAELLGNQTHNLKHPLDDPYKFINGAALAKGSEQFGQIVDPILIALLQKLGLQGQICDLGCGSGYRLRKVCEALKLPGLGIDINSDALQLFKEQQANIQNIPLSCHQADVTQLIGKWPNTHVVMQHFMTHDIHSKSDAISMLRSFHNHFPDMKYCVIVDIVASDCQQAMPGFEYVHGLQNFRVREHHEVLDVFTRGGFEIAREVPLPLPATYLWLLTPNNSL